jgi:hypothetical protein
MPTSERARRCRQDVAPAGRSADGLDDPDPRPSLEPLGRWQR